MQPEERPDPEALLARAAAEARAARRGRLRIIFGAAPGVGKTFAMLQSARQQRAEGRDVLVGLVETHGRVATEALLPGLEVLPRRAGSAGEPAEFDLEAALLRKPDVLLIDELAHTNAKGSRHAKRWQDVEAVLDAGIDVITTLNVQHIESLNDVVAQITGVSVQETVPDRIFDAADDVELIDLPTEALIARLLEGRIYREDSVDRALAHFFRRGNLTALRQIALRRTADWVDRAMRSYRRGHGIRAVWPAAERILVAVGPSPRSRHLVRAARRMAATVRGELIAVAVSRPLARATGPTAQRISENLRFAESMGAEVAMLTADDPAAELVRFAREKDVTRIVAGKTEMPRWRERFGRSFLQDLLRKSEEIDVYLVREPDEPEAQKAPTPTWAVPPATARPLDLWPWIKATAWTSCAIGAAAFAFEPPDLTVESLILLCAVVLSGLYAGHAQAAASALVASLACNFLFTEPYHTLHVTDVRDVWTLVTFLAFGLLVASLTARGRRRLAEAETRERQTRQLYALARGLATARETTDIAAAAARQAHELLVADVIVLSGREVGAPLVPLAGAGDTQWFEGREPAVARTAAEQGLVAGSGTRTLPGVKGRYLPLIGNEGREGVLALHRPPAHPFDDADALLADTIARMLALALERSRLVQAREALRIEADGERMRSALLSALSHDLRTPLATIAGHAHLLRDSAADLSPDLRSSLLAEIGTEATHLAELVASIVTATSLSAGRTALRREWTAVEELVGEGLERARTAGSHPIEVELEPAPPLMWLDAALFTQALRNLLDNALKHTKPGTRIRVTGRRQGSVFALSVADEGQGLPADKRAGLFQRPLADGEDQPGRPGPVIPEHGLGLWIAAAIVRAHDGRIRAEDVAPRGLRIVMELPIDSPAPAPPRHEALR